VDTLSVSRGHKYINNTLWDTGVLPQGEQNQEKISVSLVDPLLYQSACFA
jgi:hypothetical protein